MNTAIKDYYLIGDLHSAALISKNGSIDWLCLPHFDSPSLFAKMLDKNGGSFEILANSISCQYIKNTAILEFNFKDQKSLFKVHDFMLPTPSDTCDNHFLIRKFIGRKGLSKIKLFFNPQTEYESYNYQTNFDQKDFSIQVQAGFDSLLLHPPKDTAVLKKGQGFEIAFDLKANEVKSLILEYVMSGHKPLDPHYDMEADTVKFWHDWVSKGKFFNISLDKLIRSAITLKLMQFYPTGAIVASPTTSLPESIGGERNWDYRYVWIRDATFTLYALYVLGYMEEAERFFEFIKKIVEKREKEDPLEKGGKFDISLMYTIEGEEVPKERNLSYFAGYKNSRPVRIGNKAAGQFQLDVYGALIDSFYFISKRKIDVPRLHKKIILDLANKIANNWLKKDHGIWEVRMGVQNFTYSKVMAWVGINRTLRMAESLGLNKKEIKYYQNLENEIMQWIWRNCFDCQNNTFRQHPDTLNQDATNFLFVLLQFLDKHHPLTKIIIEKTSKELVFKDVFIYRYLTEDGLRGKEGAFLLCSFWLISAWAILEDVEKASRLFKNLEKFISSSNLLSEEMDPESLEYLGNFPQAFSHIGFIMSAYYLNKYQNEKNK